MSAPIQGPFEIESFGDWAYVVGSGGARIAECDGYDAIEKAEQVCAALNAMHYTHNAMHYIAQAIGKQKR